MTENEVAKVGLNELIDHAVEHMNEIVNKSVYSDMMEMGRYFIEKFFDNNIEEAYSKNPY